MKDFRTIFPVLLAFISTLSAYSQLPNVKWISYSEVATSTLRKVRTDREDNAIALGKFKDILVQGERLTVGWQESWQTFIGKWNQNGELIWLEHFGGVDFDGLSLTTDSKCNIIFGASFRHETDVDGQHFATNDIVGHLLLKLNPDGQIIWIKQIEYNGSQQHILTVVDSEDNIYILGSNGTSVDGVTTTGNNVLLKLSPQGEVIWSIPIGEPFSFQGVPIPTPMAINSRDEIIVLQHYVDTVEFAGEVFPSSPDTFSILISMVDSDGNELRAAQIRDTIKLDAKTVCVTPYDDIVVTGRYWYRPQFDTITLEGDNGFIAKLNHDLDFVNVKNMYLPIMREGMINGAGIFYVGDFDLMLYLEKYDFDLNLLERVFIGGGNPNNEYGISLSSFRNNETLVGGNYVHTMDVGQFVAPGDDSQFRILLARWGCSLGSDSDDCINQVAEQSPFFIYPNPTDGELNLSITGKIDAREVTVFDILGRKVFYRKSEQETELTKIDISMLPSGTYVVLLNGNIRDWAALKFVKQ